MTAPTTTPAHLRVHPYTLVRALRPAAAALGDYVVAPLDEYVQGQAELLAAQLDLPESMAEHVQGLLRWASGEDDTNEACTQLGEVLTSAVAVLRNPTVADRAAIAGPVAEMGGQMLGMVPEYRPNLQHLALWFAEHGR